MSDLPAISNKLKVGLENMDIKVTEVQFDQLVKFLALLDKWNKVYNLTAIRDPLEMVTLHILDSLSILQYVKNTQASTLLDVGAGAGLPSIPLAIMLPSINVVAIDTVQKKEIFMRQVKGELGLANFSVASGRVENYHPQEGSVGNSGFDLIVSRAFSEIALFIQITKHLVSKSGFWLAMKGTMPEHELQKLKVLPKEIVALKVDGLDAQRHLVVYENE